jgi:hypothetical protein
VQLTSFVAIVGGALLVSFLDLMRRRKLDLSQLFPRRATGSSRRYPAKSVADNLVLGPLPVPANVMNVTRSAPLPPADLPMANFVPMPLTTGKSLPIRQSVPTPGSSQPGRSYQLSRADRRLPGMEVARRIFKKCWSTRTELTGH